MELDTRRLNSTIQHHCMHKTKYMMQLINKFGKQMTTQDYIKNMQHNIESNTQIWKGDVGFG